MTTRQDIIDAARETIGTPFHHQGRAVGAGIDCVGVGVHVCRRCNIDHEDFTKYRRYPRPAVLREWLRKNLDEIKVKEARPGDVLVFWIRKPDLIQHAAILTDRGILHAVAEGVNGRGKVIEVPLTSEMKSTIAEAYRFRGVD